MTFVELTCPYCKKKFLRDLRHVNENKKLGHNSYCSLKCSGFSKKQKKILTCENPTCTKKFERSKASLSLHNFCSHSCSAKISNSKREKIIRFCANNSCMSSFRGDRKYCSKRCIPKQESKYTKSTIINELKAFYNLYERIPTKNELIKLNMAARKRFGSWNKAIIAAGFDPNPVMFSKKYVAKDGHKCDSLAEKIIDDFLYRKKISHQRSVPYGLQQMTADFLVKNIFIEYIGLQGQVKRYDLSLARKEKLWKEKNLKIIKIYPKDLFPHNKLNEILENLS